MLEDVVKSLQTRQPSEDIFSSDNTSHALSRGSSYPPTSTLPDFRNEPRASLPFKHVEDMGLVQRLSTESKLEQQQLVPSLSSDIQEACGTTNVSGLLTQVIKDGAARLHELSVNVSDIKDMTSVILELVSMNNKLMFEINQLASENKTQLAEITLLQQDLASRQDEMKKLQIQALDRLAQLQNGVQALLTQTYELHEYPIPRLFIVLPDDRSSWNPLDFSNKFKLYFLCECGEHTKATKSNIPHRIHLAKHQGYEIERPTEFFQQYGSYVLTILRMLKFGISVAGIAVPALSNLIPDALDQATENLRLLTNTIESGMDQVMNHIEKVSASDGGIADRSSEQMENNEALEGADLRQLETFLKNKDKDRVLGNLYRTLTTKGHVKWVCIDHYRENYHEKAAKAFLDAVEALEGTFNETIGRVEVKLHSKVTAEQFYAALEKSRSVYELRIELDWETSQSDFKKLRDTLALTNVGVLELYLRQQDGLTKDILNRNQRYDPVLDIMKHPSIKSFAIRGPQNLSRRSSLLSRDDDFSNLRYLDISLYELKDDLSSATHLIKKASNLSSLAVGTGLLGNDNGYALEAYNGIAEYRTYPINFKDWRLCIPPTPKESNLSMTTQHCMEHLLKVCCKSNRSMLDVDTLDKKTVDTISKATTNGSAFKEFELFRNGQLGDSFINNLSSIVSRSELYYFNISMKEDEGRVRILESIQWKYLRRLEIILYPWTFEARVMRALVDGVTKMSEKVGLNQFQFWSETRDTLLSLPEGDLLQTFVASTSIRYLRLEVTMTLEQILSLLRSADVSRMYRLDLWAKDFDSAKVNAILDGLQRVKKLRVLYLLYANITYEQKSRMKARGVYFSAYVF